MDAVAPADPAGRNATRPCPFIGARPFEGSDKAFFFGRDREASDLATMVAACTLTVVYGPSGAGKSSLLNTRLADELELLEPDWMFISFNSWQDRFEAPLMGAVRDALPLGEMKPDVSSDAGVNRLAPTLLGAAKETGRPIVLILDQFEEYFLYQGSGAVDFEIGIARLANRRSSAVRVVMSLRSDRLFLLDRLRSRIPDILQNLFLIDRLDEVGAQAAVLKPIEAYNRQPGRMIPNAIGADDDVVDAVVRGADEREIFQRLPFRGRGTVNVSLGGTVHSGTGQSRLRTVAPFLQLAMEALWRQDIEIAGGSRLTLAGLRVLAKAADDTPAQTLVGQLVQQHLDSLLSARSEAEQTVCAKLFDRMVTYAGGKVAIAVPHDLKAVLDEGQLAMAGPLLDSLAAPGPSRLVRPVATDDPSIGGFGETAATRYEIVHDALAVPILDWVSRWRERRAGQETAEREQAAAAKALADATAREALERAQREAAEAREAAQRQRFAIAQAEARRSARLWKRGSIAFVASLIVVSAFWWFVTQFQTRRDAIERFDTFSTEHSGSEYRLRLMLALSSLNEVSGLWQPLLDSAPAETILHQTLLRAPRYGGSVWAAAPDDGASRLAMLSPEGGLAVLTPHDGLMRTVMPAAELNRLRKAIRPSISKKMAQVPFLVTGFIAGLHDPAIIIAGQLVFRSNEPGAKWRTVDVASLLPDGFDSQPGFYLPEITAGALQIISLNFNEQRVMRLRPVAGSDGTMAFVRGTALPPTIRWRGQRQRPALSPWMPSAPRDRFASLSFQGPSAGDGQVTSEELEVGDLSMLGAERAVWSSTPQTTTEHVQSVIQSAGATINPSIAFSADGSAIVVRVGPAVDIVQSAPEAAGTGAPARAKSVSFQASTPFGDGFVSSGWSSPPIAATQSEATGTHGALWRVAWRVSGGLALFDVTGEEGKASSPKVLLTSLDSIARLDFSADGRFLIGQASPKFDGMPHQLEVWDLGEDWQREVSGSSGALLKEQACKAASIARPGGNVLDHDEQITWLTPNGGHPCIAEGGG